MCRGWEKDGGGRGGGGRKRSKVCEMYGNRDVTEPRLRCGSGSRGQHGKRSGRSRRRADDEIRLHHPHNCFEQPARRQNRNSLRKLTVSICTHCMHIAAIDTYASDQNRAPSDCDSVCVDVQL
jgi:hypothetical protein